MNRNERNTIHGLLKATHSQGEKRDLSPAWRNSVMEEIAKTGMSDGSTTELERLAPQFALAAATLSVLLMATASWTLKTLPGELYSAYASQVFNIVPATLTSL